MSKSRIWWITAEFPTKETPVREAIIAPDPISALQRFIQNADADFTSVTMRCEGEVDVVE